MESESFHHSLTDSESSTDQTSSNKDDKHGILAQRLAMTAEVRARLKNFADQHRQRRDWVPLIGLGNTAHTMVELLEDGTRSNEEMIHQLTDQLLVLEQYIDDIEPRFQAVGTVLSHLLTETKTILEQHKEGSELPVDSSFNY